MASEYGMVCRSGQFFPIGVSQEVTFGTVDKFVDIRVPYYLGANREELAKIFVAIRNLQNAVGGQLEHPIVSNCILASVVNI